MRLKSFSKSFTHTAETLVHILELLISVSLIFGMLFEGSLLGKQMWQLWLHGGHTQTFQVFLDNALMYIIGLEVVMMLVKRDPNIMLDILIFAIARKMIVDMSTGIDFVLGAVAIGLLYVVKCYGVSCLLLPGYFRRSPEPKDPGSST